jgi:hypothetical protein
VTLKVKIVIASVRTAACAHSQRHPSRMSSRTRACCPEAPCTGSRTFQISITPASTHTLSVTNGSAIPAANSAAPTGGPASWFHTITPVRAREFAIPRSGFSTSIGSSVAVVVSPKASFTPNRNRAARTTAMSTRCVRIDAVTSSRIAASGRPLAAGRPPA